MALSAGSDTADLLGSFEQLEPARAAQVLCTVMRTLALQANGKFDGCLFGWDVTCRCVRLSAELMSDEPAMAGAGDLHGQQIIGRR